MTIIKKSHLVNLLAAIMVFTALGVSAEQSLRAQNIESITPDYINNISVIDEGEGVKIEGQTADNQNLSKYMRFLQKHVGLPSLIKVSRVSKNSVFVLQIKKFKQ